MPGKESHKHEDEDCHWYEPLQIAPPFDFCKAKHQWVQKMLFLVLLNQKPVSVHHVEI